MQLKLLLLFVSVSFFLSSCGLYNGGFQKGGELTSTFLERIEEMPKDEEDKLRPKNEEKNKCSKP